MKSEMLIEPGSDVGTLVGTVIIQNKMDLQTFGDFLVDPG